MPPRPTPESRAHWAVAYFRSGWAFLVPYVLVYFAYAWLKWPVNPAASAESASSSLLPAPCSLLHFYWFLHGLHLILGAIALRAWRLDSAGLRSPVSILQNVIPWLGLALLFWIPGVYLEFPSDPWQHLARTNEWVWLDQVTEHSYWKKSSYFLAYSLVGRISPPVTQLRWFDLYYTGCCLLLCWQYYRLARAVGLSERSSLLFVLLNALVFGNNLFGFYRYYGMSSTVFAQLGAVALTRIVLETMRGRPEAGGRRLENPNPDDPVSSAATKTLATRGSFRLSPSAFRLFISRLPPPVSRLLQLAGTSFAVLPLIAGNHLQGLLIAGAGVAAVVCWRLIAWRRSMMGWLALAAVIASVATVLWWPRHALLDSSYRPGGWLTSWYAFNLFQPSSAGFQRAWVMIGAFGGLNLAAAVWLLCRNHVVGWLTLMPVLLLCLPCFALPFTNSLAASTDVDGGYIAAFHRLLFAIPAGLALIVVLGGREQGAGSMENGERRALNGRQDRLHAPFSVLSSPFYLVLISLAALTTLPAASQIFNRLYSALMIPPADLALQRTVNAVSHLIVERPDPRLGEKLITAYGPGYAAKAAGLENLILATKWNNRPQPTTTIWLHNYLRVVGRTPSDWIFLPPEHESLITPGSIAAQLSGHWPPYFVATESTGRPETIHTALAIGGKWRTYGGFQFIEHRSNNGPPVRRAQ